MLQSMGLQRVRHDLVTEKWKWKSLSPVRLFATPWILHGILQARMTGWVAVPFSRESSQSRDRTQVSCIAGGFFTSWATREAQWLNNRQSVNNGGVMTLFSRELKAGLVVYLRDLEVWGRPIPYAEVSNCAELIEQGSSFWMFRSVVPNLFGTRNRFHEKEFFYGPGWGWGDGLGMI